MCVCANILVGLQNERGKYELRFLFVELDGRPNRTIVIEDNR